MATGKLTWDDPLLPKASKQFPEDARIAKLAVALADKAGKPLE